MMMTIWAAASVEISGLEMWVEDGHIHIAVSDCAFFPTPSEARGIALTLNNMADAIDLQKGDE